MAITKQTVLDVLGTIELPGEESSIVAAGLVTGAAACDGHIKVTLAGGLPERRVEALKRTIEGAVRAYGKMKGESVVGVIVEVGGGGGESSKLKAQSSNEEGRGHKAGAGASAPDSEKRVLPNVKHIIAVGAGKGGVGKSTIAVNLGVGLALRGHAVGVMDGDIYGPSLPTMLGLDALQANMMGSPPMLQPFYVHGVKAMTIGKLVDPEKPLIWRGPMAHGAFKQLVEQTEWGPLDYLIIDLPPGTGDVALTMAQMLKLTGAVIVCTPQKVAQDDAVRALRMFQQLNIDVLGVVENMSYFIADDISPPREYDIFGRGGAQKMAQRTGVPFLGAVPITVALRKNSDEGNPGANFKGKTALAAALDAMVGAIEGQAALAAARRGGQTPVVTVS